MPSDPPVFDELKLPFIFVPHGEPEPTEWLASHPDHIKLPATFVPRAGGDGGTDPSSGSPPAGQRRTIDGLAPPPDPAAPWRPTKNAEPNATQAGTNESSDPTLIGAEPVAAYCRANEALATAASDYASGRAGVSNRHAYPFNAAPNLSDPPGQSPVRDGQAAPGLLERLSPIGTAHAQSFSPAKVDLLSDELRGGHTLEKHVGKTHAWLDNRLSQEPKIPGSLDLSKPR